MSAILQPQRPPSPQQQPGAASIRIVTELDSARLFGLLRRQASSAPAARAVIDVIDSADLVAPQDVAADVVTMQSLVIVADLASGQQRELALCYPADADAGAGRLSVLSPVGLSLLGRRAGDVAQWTMPDGTQGAARIVEVLFQPEASGDYLG